MQKLGEIIIKTRVSFSTIDSEKFVLRSSLTFKIYAKLLDEILLGRFTQVIWFGGVKITIIIEHFL